MRRMLVSLLAAGLVAGMTAGSATAGTIKLHSDPNDTSSVLDIRKVGSDTSARKVFLGVATWDAFTMDDLKKDDHSWFLVYLDTKNRGRADRRVYMSWDSSKGKFLCSMFIVGGGFKGAREANTDPTAISCVLPRSWFDIQKQVKFAVESYDMGNFEDRAPNDGRYLGL
jgi:hypothetical protein